MSGYQSIRSVVGKHTSPVRLRVKEKALISFINAGRAVKGWLLCELSLGMAPPARSALFHLPRRRGAGAGAFLARFADRVCSPQVLDHHVSTTYHSKRLN